MENSGFNHCDNCLLDTHRIRRTLIYKKLDIFFTYKCFKNIFPVRHHFHRFSYLVPFFQWDCQFLSFLTSCKQVEFIKFNFVSVPMLITILNLINILIECDERKYLKKKKLIRDAYDECRALPYSYIKSCTLYAL